ncbi:hypothetical protein DXG01_010611 [Tephrocybe rancida]|nr:hypothetical protein DXG01_010611 [Tephrocybe rancida]
MQISNKNVFLTGFILAIVVANAIMGTVWVVQSMQLNTFDELLEISPITISINALSTAADIIIAASLCFMLHRARTGFKRSDSMINRLMLFVVNTGVYEFFPPLIIVQPDSHFSGSRLTSMCAIASLVSLVVSPLTLIYATFYFCIGRLYTNSFLATLNARRTISGKVDDVSHMLVSIPPTLLNTHQSAASKKGSQQTISIRIDTTQEHSSDPNRDLRSRGRLDDKDLFEDDLSYHRSDLNHPATDEQQSHASKKPEITRI